MTPARRIAITAAAAALTAGLVFAWRAEPPLGLGIAPGAVCVLFPAALLFGRPSARQCASALGAILVLRALGASGLAPIAPLSPALVGAGLLWLPTRQGLAAGVGLAYLAAALSSGRCQRLDPVQLAAAAAALQWVGFAPLPSLATRISAPYAAGCAAVAQALAALPAHARLAFAPLVREVWLHALARERADYALAQSASPSDPSTLELAERRLELEASEARLVAVVRRAVASALTGG